MIPSTELFFDDTDGAHLYRAGERRLTSVTSLLRNAKLYPTYDFLATSNKISDPGKYKSLGTAVHSACHLLDLGLLDEESLHPEVAQRMVYYKRFKYDTGYQPRVWELPLGDPDRDIAGMLDSMGECGEEIWLPDIKTGTVPIVGVGTQLAGYFDLVTNRGQVMLKTLGEDSRVPPTDLEWFESVRRQVKRIRRVSVNLTTKAYTVRTHEELRWSRYWAAAVVLHAAWKEHGL